MPKQLLRSHSKVANFAVLNADCTGLFERYTAPRAWRNPFGGRSMASRKSCIAAINPVDYPACTSHAVKVNPYSQVFLRQSLFSSNRIHRQQLALRAFPFRVEILSLAQIVAEHARCFGREQDILNPLHYLGLLEQRPELLNIHPDTPVRQNWPADYERLLATLRQNKTDGSGIREFITILKLHRSYRKK